MPEYNFAQQPKNPALDKPEKKRKKPIFTILTAALIIVLALLLLCLIPGKPVLSLVLPTPKPVVVPLESLAFQEIIPPAGGGVSQIVFPIPGTTGITPPPTCPSSDPVCLPPVTPPPIIPPPTTPPPTIPPPTTPPPITPPPGTPPPTTPPPTGEPSNLMDRGDAPDVPAGKFPSLDANDGARHKDVSRFYLGEKVDREVDSHQVDKDSPNPAIGGDDGLVQVKVIPNIAAGGVSIWELTIKLKNENWEAANPIFLNVLYDLNGDLDWNDPNERILADKEFLIQKGETVFHTIPIVNPDCCILNWVRLTATDIALGANYNGSWPVPFEYGETEDHFSSKAYPPHFFFTSWVHWPPGSESTVVHIPPSWTGTPTGKIVPPRDTGPGVIVPEIPLRTTPTTGVDVPTFDPGRYRPVASNDGKSIIGFHETLTTKIIRVKPFDSGLLLGQPPYWTPTYDEGGRPVGLHGVHDTNRTQTKEAKWPLVFVGELFPKSPTGLVPKVEKIQNVRIVISRGTEGGFFQVLSNKVYDALRSLLGQGFFLTARDWEAYNQITLTVAPRPPIREILRTIRVPQFITAPPAQTGVPPDQTGVPPQTGLPPAQVSGKVCNISGESSAIQVPGSNQSLNVVTLKGECGYDDCDWELKGLSRTGELVYGSNIPHTNGKNRIIIKYPEGVIALQVKANCDAISYEASPSISPFGLQAGGGTSGAAAGGDGCAALSITTSSPLNQAQEGTSYPELQTLAASGGTAPLSWSRPSGTFPPGLSLSSGGVISGTPDPNSAATYSFTIRVTDSCSPVQTNDRDFTLVVTSGA